MAIDNTLDQAIILLYLISIFSISFYYSSGSQNKGQNYFSDKRLSPVIGSLSFFVTNLFVVFTAVLLKINHESLIGLILFVIILSILFVLKNQLSEKIEPKISSYSIETGAKSVLYFSFLLLTLMKVTSLLFITSFIFKFILGWNPAVSTIIIVLLTGIYTIIGGSQVVTRTKLFQAIFALISITVILLTGVEHIEISYPVEFSDFTINLFNSGFSYLVVITASLIVVLWYFLTSHFSLPNLRSRFKLTIKEGAVLGVLLIIPIIISFSYSNIKEISKVPLNEAFILFNSLKHGFKGLLIAGIFSFLMLAFSNFLLNTAAIFTLGIYKKRFPDSSEYKLVFTGRLITIFLVFILIICIPFVQILEPINFLRIITFPVYICSPVLAYFLFNQFTKKIGLSETLLLLSLFILAGMTKFINEFISLSFYFHLITDLSLPDFILIQFISTVSLFVLINKFSFLKQSS